MMTALLVVIFISFIGLGLPDSILGTAWPAIYTEFGLPVSLAGYISMAVSLCTVISSLLSSLFVKKIGPGLVTALSTGLTALGIIGMALTKHPFYFFIYAIPLGLGAGAVDTALNNFVALHYNARVMNFLHCFYGLGVSATPYIMSLTLKGNNDWRNGFLAVGVIQLLITIITFIALPLWKKVILQQKGKFIEETKVLTIPQMFKIAPVRTNCLVFFSICAIEFTAGSWSSTFFVTTRNLYSDVAAKVTMLFYIGLTLGRFLSGLLAKKIGSWEMIRWASLILILSVLLITLPLPVGISALALLLLGLGVGPVFPSLTHLTPINFGKDISVSIIGLQQAIACLGIMIMPWVYGVLAEIFSLSIFPTFLLVLFIIYYTAFIKLKKQVIQPTNFSK
jgi:fucose permease